jgi:hypothetical protein
VSDFLDIDGDMIATSDLFVEKQFVDVDILFIDDEGDFDSNLSKKIDEFKFCTFNGIDDGSSFGVVLFVD